jgi:hypothetical protein
VVNSRTPTVGASVTLTATCPMPAVGSSASGTASALAAAWLAAGRSSTTAALAPTMARVSLASTHQWRVRPQRVPSPSRTPVASAASANGSSTAETSRSMAR